MKKTFFAAFVVWAALVSPAFAQIQVYGMTRQDGRALSDSVRVRIVRLDASYREVETVAEFGRCKTDVGVLGGADVPPVVPGFGCVSHSDNAFSVFTGSNGQPIPAEAYYVHVFDRDSYGWEYVDLRGGSGGFLSVTLWSTEVKLLDVQYSYAYVGYTRYLVVRPLISNPHGYRLTVRVRLKAPSWNAGEATLGTSYEYTLTNRKQNYVHYFLAPEHLREVADGVLHPEIEVTFAGDTWMAISARDNLPLRVDHTMNTRR